MHDPGKVPEQLTDEQVLFLADILPTSYEVGVLNGMVWVQISWRDVHAGRGITLLA